MAWRRFSLWCLSLFFAWKKILERKTITFLPFSSSFLLKQSLPPPFLLLLLLFTDLTEEGEGKGEEGPGKNQSFISAFLCQRVLIINSRRWGRRKKERRRRRRGGEGQRGGRNADWGEKTEKERTTTGCLTKDWKQKSANFTGFNKCAWR